MAVSLREYMAMYMLEASADRLRSWVVDLKSKHRRAADLNARKLERFLRRCDQVLSLPDDSAVWQLPVDYDKEAALEVLGWDPQRGYAIVTYGPVGWVPFTPRRWTPLISPPELEEDDV